jgi:hypothetical protein
LKRILLAFQCFFAILFRGRISPEAAEALGLSPAPAPTKAAPPAAPPGPPADLYNEGAVRMLAILQRDARLVDFLMEDISAYPDEQVGAAVRTLHDEGAKSLARYVEVAAVIDGIEGEVIRVEESGPFTDASAVKFLGNLPAQGRPRQGLLRHRGWRALRLELPAAVRGSMVIAPAEIEAE